MNHSTLELRRYDASGEQGWPSQGPLTLLRNVPRVTHLWREVPRAEELLQAEGIQRVNEWHFGRALLEAEGVRIRPVPFPVHLYANARHGPWDIAWWAGRLVHLPSCGEAAYFHVAGWKGAVAGTADLPGAALRDEDGVLAAWLVGPEGVRAPSAGEMERLRACREKADRRGIRYVWDRDLSSRTPMGSVRS